ncbi:MAG: hypothetical protein RLZZ124_1671, partial [Cyanobacteriota bacterium]
MTQPNPSPPAPALSHEQRIARMIRQQGGRGDALIEVLHQVQELEGYLSPAALHQVATGLSLPLSRVQGVASFYHLFRLEAPTPHRCAVCLGTACFVKGGADLARALERHLGVRLDDAAGNGNWALQHVSCLGACGQAPVLVESGLVIHQQDEGSEEKRYDRFRDRIMFPIRNIRGECIGFGGRVMGQGTPKYLNSPETPVFSKGRELYGLYEARQAIRDAGYVLVTEGYMDVVALAQLGFAQAVATLGTACTTEHVQKLFRVTDSVVFSFDGDAAGRRAARKALDGALPYATDVRSIRFLFLPDPHDPDSFVREFGADAFNPSISGDDADPDGDRIPNILEYSLRSSPKAF